MLMKIFCSHDLLHIKLYITFKTSGRVIAIFEFGFHLSDSVLARISGRVLAIYQTVNRGLIYQALQKSNLVLAST